MNDLLTIVIPVKNEEKNLPACLENVRDFRNVVVVDSGSSDRTREIFEGFRKKVSEIGAVGLRKLAERKVGEWLAGVTSESFAEALVQLVGEKAAQNEYRFKHPEDCATAMAGAQRFFDEFAEKIIELSDGRCVYFAPDKRALDRNDANRSRCWAEYAFHAVSSSGKILDGRNYRERLFSRSKLDALEKICEIIRHEHCMYRLIDSCPENDAVLFIGRDAEGGRVEVVTRLDEYGNVNTNLGEVTVIVQHKRNKQTPPPEIRPLAEVVETVAKHQAAGFSPSTTPNSIANQPAVRKGGRNWDWVDFKWNGQFPKKRNWILRNYKFKTPWVMFLDADEFPNQKFWDELESVLPNTKCVGFWVGYDIWFLGRILRHGVHAHKTAILRLGHGEYEKIEEKKWSKLDMEIHEHIIFDGPVGSLSTRIEHHDKKPLSAYYDRHNAYSSWEAERYQKITDYSILTFRQRVKYFFMQSKIYPVFYFFAFYVLKFGFLDGQPGFFFAIGKLCQLYHVRAKVYEVKHRTEFK